MPNWCDTHFHFDDDLYAAPAEITRILQQARNQGVMLGLLQATTPRNAPKVVETAHREPGIYAAVGHHPLDLEEYQGIDCYLPLYDDPRVIAVGEIGLDYHYAPESAAKQQQVFSLFLQLAVKKNLPIVIHSRDAVADCLKLVEENCPRGFPMVIHSFTGTVEEAQAWLKRDAYLSINGMITFKKNENIKALLDILPQDRILLETDSPYLAPVPLRGSINTPANIPLIGAKVAELRGWSLEETAAITTENAKRLFPGLGQ